MLIREFYGVLLENKYGMKKLQMEGVRMDYYQWEPIKQNNLHGYKRIGMGHDQEGPILIDLDPSTWQEHWKVLHSG